MPEWLRLPIGWAVECLLPLRFAGVGSVMAADVRGDEMITQVTAHHWGAARLRFSHQVRRAELHRRW
jgi:hypothetical protein